MKTAVVILNYNTKEYLKKFLPGLLASTKGLNAEVFVADNASTDGTSAMMKAEFPAVPYLQFDSNYGFTGGYNKALKGLDAEYYVLINSDIEVPSGWLSPLVEWMDTHPECGACGPKLVSYNDRSSFEYAGAAGGFVDRYGYPFCRGRILQKLEKDNGQYNTPLNVMWCSGACLMVRSHVWHLLRGFDDRFFAHMEEIDLCWRMQLGGWKVTNVPASEVYHIGGGTLPNESPLKLRLNFRNNLLLLENNLPATFAASKSLFPRFRARRRIFVRMCLDGLSAIVYLIKGKTEFYQAVVLAHKEYRQLRTPGPMPEKPKLPEGLYKGWIVPKGLF